MCVDASPPSPARQSGGQEEQAWSGVFGEQVEDQEEDRQFEQRVPGACPAGSPGAPLYWTLMPLLLMVTVLLPTGTVHTPSVLLALAEVVVQPTLSSAMNSVEGSISKP